VRSYKELHAKFSLQRGDGAGNSRRRDVQFSGNPGEAALLGGEKECTKGFVVVHVIVLQIAILSN
jgi:hypothetical protein